MARAEEQAHTAVAVDELVASIAGKLRRVQDEASRRGEPPTIHRVRPGIRDECPRAYSPKIVSLGPFHRGEDGLRGMEKVKQRFMNHLLGRSPTQNSVQKYVDAVRGCAQRARAQYSEDINLRDNEFVEMMVLDGCFLLECMVKRALGSGLLERELAAANYNTNLLRADSLLVENQIPFVVVQALFDASVIDWTLASGRGAPPMRKIAAHFLKIKNPQRVPASGIHHLLHLFHWSLNPDPSPEQSHNPNPPPGRPHNPDPPTPPSTERSHNPSLPAEQSNNRDPPTPRMIPCATELLEAGIRIKKRRFKDAGDSSFVKVSFEDGTLRIPFLSVEEFTGYKFRNLIAFEQSCQDAGSYFTSFAVFMDNIVNTAADVAVLRRHGIIESKLGSDEEVAEVFNTVCKGADLNYEDHHLAPVFKEVKRYSELRYHRWRATLVHNYFSSPWAAISVLAAVVLLLLAVLQAAYAILSYRHRRDK